MLREYKAITIIARYLTVLTLMYDQKTTQFMHMLQQINKSLSVKQSLQAFSGKIISLLSYDLITTTLSRREVKD